MTLKMNHLHMLDLSKCKVRFSFSQILGSNVTGVISKFLLEITHSNCHDLTKPGMNVMTIVIKRKEEKMDVGNKGGGILGSLITCVTTCLGQQPI